MEENESSDVNEYDTLYMKTAGGGNLVVYLPVAFSFRHLFHQRYLDCSAFQSSTHHF